MNRNLDSIAEELFNHIRSRFPSIEIGNEGGEIVDEPRQARFFEFDYEVGGNKIGKMNATIDPADGLVLMYNKDFTENSTIERDNWFDFLKSMRTFAKKRLMNFEVRDINRSNLTKRDYKFLATNRTGETTMAESKMYGTNKTSYQKIGNARLAIKHNAPINVENLKDRTKNIGAIYIESADGERFKYPYKHLSGARAMARHVSEGGNAYDDFGKYISGMSGELANLRKFKQYMNRSSVMAESLGEYMGIVNERIASVKKTVQNLQKQAYYTEAFEEFVPMDEIEVPEAVANNWIDQLTIKQFNEDLKGVFPYIYNLVSEATSAEELTFEGLMHEQGPEGEEYHMVKSGDTVYSLAQTFGIAPDDIIEVNGLDDAATIRVGEKLIIPGITQADYDQAMGTNIGAGGTREIAPNGQPTGSTRGINPVDNYGAAGAQRLTQSVEYAIESLMGQFREAANDCDETCPKSCPDCGGTGNPAKYQASIKEAKCSCCGSDPCDCPPDCDCKQNESNECSCQDMDDTPKISIPDFILSYFDRESGQFPKGETAVLTAVGKEYGENMIQPANKFIERLNAKVAEVMGYREAEIEMQPNPELSRISALAGLR